jgi:hypothetical protein
LLDPGGARKATRATRDVVFFKLNAYVHNLNCMGKVPWKNFNDIPCESIYNMEHRSKVIADAVAIIKNYTEMPEGDDKMNMHITACLTIRANGKSKTQTPKADFCVIELSCSPY